MICQQQTVAEDVLVMKEALPAGGLLSFFYSVADAVATVFPVWAMIAAALSGFC